MKRDSWFLPAVIALVILLLVVVWQPPQEPKRITLAYPVTFGTDKLTKEQQERMLLWQRTITQYFEQSHKPASTSVKDDVAWFIDQLGTEYTMTPNQIERLRWLNDNGYQFQNEEQLLHAGLEHDGAKGYPVLVMTDEHELYSVNVRLSPDAKAIDNILGPAPYAIMTGDPIQE